MKEMPLGLMDLITKSDSLLAKTIADENFKMDSVFEQKKEDFLDIHEMHLSNNKMMGRVVTGLQETIENVHRSDINELLVNILIADNDLSLTIYTDTSYTVILGVI